MYIGAHTRTRKHTGSILHADEMSDGKLLQADNAYYIQSDIYEELSGNLSSHHSISELPSLLDEARFIRRNNRNTPSGENDLSAEAVRSAEGQLKKLGTGRVKQRYGPRLAVSPRSDTNLSALPSGGGKGNTSRAGKARRAARIRGRWRRSARRRGAPERPALTGGEPEQRTPSPPYCSSTINPRSSGGAERISTGP
ncbi:hypothetical protein AOLI_G00165950 [Acnodon oligacanthus]